MSFGDMYDDDRWIQPGTLRHPGGVTEPAQMFMRIRSDDTVIQKVQPRKEDNDMKLVNHEAEGLASAILSERRTEGLREQVEAAVTHLSELFESAGDGSVFSFGREAGGRTYHYAAIKSGGKWYSTGNATALKGVDDDNLVTWLVGLGIYDEADLIAVAKAPQSALIEGRVADDREPQPGDGPDYHAGHAAWATRQK